MKKVGGLIFAIGSAVGLCFVGSATASLLMDQQSEPAAVAMNDVTDLWTTKPTRVDVGSQTFERLASIAPVDAVSAPQAIASVGKVEGPAVSEVQVEAQADERHSQWCAERYRSYNPETDTYRTYAGQIRTCASPYETADAGMSVAGGGFSQAHYAWCADHYRSYQADTNSYRSYSGAMRDCISPHM